jgi:hypothetical protein
MFSKGIQKGKMMGHEMSGVILVLVATLRSTRGRRFILEEARGKQKEFMPDDNFITDWIKLLETQLQFEQWLSRPELNVASVMRAKTKIREYMNMTKVIAKRTKGMGSKTQNFHGAIHIPDTILHFGVPANFNTFHNERHHKRDKASSKRTNRRPTTFDMMVSEKILHRHAVDLAVQEIKGHKRWNYFKGPAGRSLNQDDNMANEPFDPKLGGTATKVKMTLINGHPNWSFKITSKMKNKARYDYDQMTKDCLTVIADTLYYKGQIEEFWIYSQLTLYDPAAVNSKQIYYASPYKDGGPWFDWAIFDLSSLENFPDDSNHVPCQLKCFIDLRNIPRDVADRINKLPGIYAMAEEATLDTSPAELERSEIWTLWTKKPCYNLQLANAGSNQMTFLPTNCITGPTVVIPDLDNNDQRAYLKMSALATWADDFDDWLNEDHTRQFDEAQIRG